MNRSSQMQAAAAAEIREVILETNFEDGIRLSKTPAAPSMTLASLAVKENQAKSMEFIAVFYLKTPAGRMSIS